MLERWLQTCPELDHVALDVAPGKPMGTGCAPVPALALRLRSEEERLLMACLDHIASGNSAYALEASLQGPQEGGQLPDLQLLAGALLLGEGRCAEAAEVLSRLRIHEQADAGRPSPGLSSEPLGLPTRRLYPQLRLLLRIAPTQLLPLYPDAYGVLLLLVVAHWRAGNPREALQLLTEADKQLGSLDEKRLLAGQLELQKSDTRSAVAALTAAADQAHDALSLVRASLIAHVQFERGELRAALRELRPTVLYTRDANPHTQARARIVLAQVYAQARLPLEALRISSAVPAKHLPPFVAQWLAESEARCLQALAELSEIDVERMARADAVTLHIPEADDVLKQRSSKLDITRSPLDELRPSEMSWVKRREQEQQIGEIKAAAARGEQVTLGEPVYSTEAREFMAAVRQLQQWWPERQRALRLSGPDSLARNPAECAHLRFDFRGTREAPVYDLPCERRLTLLTWAAGVSTAILIVLLLLRACTQGV